MVKSRPEVILSAAISLDGKIATKSGDSKLSSTNDKKRVHKLRTKVDAILVGRNTVQRDNPLLSVRHTRGKNPTRVILDSKCTIDTKSKIIQTCSKIPTIIAVSKNASKKNLDRIKKFPLEVIVTGRESVDIKGLLRILYRRKKIKRILLEGGGTTNWTFVRQNLIDRAIITITPFLIGGSKSVTLIEGDGFASILKSTKLKLEKINQRGNEIVLYYSF